MLLEPMQEIAYPPIRIGKEKPSAGHLNPQLDSSDRMRIETTLMALINLKIRRENHANRI
jgi:hypothetical protein